MYQDNNRNYYTDIKNKFGNSAPKCDFRFKNGGKTTKGWPLESLEEFKN